MFCRLPAGARGCAPEILPRPPFGIAHDPHLVRRPADGALFAVATGVDGSAAPLTYLWSSDDGGLTWSGPVTVGAGLRDLDAVALAPGGNALDVVEGIVSHDGFQRVPLGGPPERRVVQLLPEPDGASTVFYYSLGIAELPGGHTMLVADDHHRVTRGPELGFPVSPANADIPHRFAIAADDASGGWLVWTDGEGSGAHVGHVRALPLVAPPTGSGPQRAV